MSLVLKNVAKRYGDTLLFENLNLELHPGERVALLGRNGSGKTTLLKVAAGLLQPDEGSVSCLGTVAYLEQHGLPKGKTVQDAVTPQAVAAAHEALAEAQAALSEPSDRNLLHYAEAEERYRLLGGYENEVNIGVVLAGLALEPAARLGALSGGQLRRAMLARLLLSPATVYLLDEPTNHLDVESAQWLEDWVRAREAGFLIVSHDRAFLDATVTRCYELERGRLNSYPGNYSEATHVKEAQREAQLKAHDSYQRKVRQLETEMQHLKSRSRSADVFNQRRAGNVAKIGAKNKAEAVSRTFARQARALQSRLQHMEEPEKPHMKVTRVSIPVDEVRHGPNEVLKLDNLTLARGGKMLLERVNVSVRRGERVALLGANGSGKSSLLQTVLGRLEPMGGSVTLGRNLEVYWAGQHGEELEGFDTLEDALLAANPGLKPHDLYELFAKVGLPKNPKHPLSGLSGGERTRLSLARLSVTRAQLLVLDEPTNHLDITAIEALEALLQDYPGTVLFSSHDRRLVAGVATRRLLLQDGELNELDMPTLEVTHA